jgi:light-regulated signal transduction histidine kinase (bacteriophytochrome)
VLIQQKEAIVDIKPLPKIQGAAVLIYQLFYNLTNNALKFTREGVAPKIMFWSEPSNGSSTETVFVKDNGIGFNQAYAQKIFETFSRLNSKDKFEGTGLGLSLCKKIVERHGGQITALGMENEGAMFTIELPRDRTIDSTL